MPRIMNYQPTVLDTIIGPPGEAKGCSCGCGRCSESTGREMEDEFGGRSRQRRGVRPTRRASTLPSARLRARARPAPSSTRVTPRLRPRTAARANSFFARRLGWGQSLRPIARRMKTRPLPPGSLQLVLAIARWQAANGLRPTGVLDPDTLARLQGQTGEPAEPTVDATPDDAKPTDASPDDQVPDASPTNDAAPTGAQGGEGDGVDAEFELFT